MKKTALLITLALLSFGFTVAADSPITVDSRYGNLWQNDPRLKALGLFSHPNSSGLCGTTVAENLISKLRLITGEASGFTDEVYELNYLVTQLAPAIGLQKVIDGITSKQLTQLLNAYFGSDQANLPYVATLVQSEELTLTNLQLSTQNGGWIIHMFRSPTGTPQSTNFSQLHGGHFLLVGGFASPNRVVLLDPDRPSDQQARTATLKPVTMQDGKQTFQINFDDQAGKPGFKVIANLIKVPIKVPGTFSGSL